MSPLKDKINRKFNVGVIGLGRQAMEDHIPAIFSSSDVQLVGVADIDQEKLASFSRKYQDVHTYGNFEDLLRLEKLDFVIVVVPHYLHKDVMQKAIQRKIHILKEKPFAVSLAEAKEILKLAEKNNVKIALTLQRRFNPIYYTFFQFIDKIGAPFFIDAKYTFYTNAPHDGWRGRRELAGGGCLIDMGYHIIDLLMWYFGLPDVVFSETSCAAKEGIVYDAEDTAQTTFRYSKKNIFGSLLVSRSIPPKTEYFDVYGTRGIIHIERGKIERRASNGEVLESLTRENHWPSAAHDQLEYFVKVLKKEKENITGPAFHLNHLAFIEAAYRSKIFGKPMNPQTLFHEEVLQK